MVVFSPGLAKKDADDPVKHWYRLAEKYGFSLYVSKLYYDHKYNLTIIYSPVAQQIHRDILWNLLSKFSLDPKK